jgi:hypothetical protein
MKNKPKKDLPYRMLIRTVEQACASLKEMPKFVLVEQSVGTIADHIQEGF